MTKKLSPLAALLASTLLAQACGTSQDLDLTLGVTLTDETVESLETWPTALVATVRVDQQTTPDARDGFEATTEILAVFCDAGEVPDALIERRLQTAFGPCREGTVTVEVALAPLTAGSDCDAPFDRIAFGEPEVLVEVDALELGETCGRYDATVDAEL